MAKRKRRAFTLIELLIAFLITGVVMSVVLSFFFSVFKNYEFHQDISEAKQRGQVVLATIQPFVLNAGLGLPYGKTAFQNAFSGLSVLFPPQEKRQFRSYVQLASDGIEAPEVSTDGKLIVAAPALWLVYSVPSGTGVNDEIDIKKTVQQKIAITGDINTQQIVPGTTETSSLKSWISFPFATSPFCVVVRNSSSLEVVSQFDQTIAAFDELYYVRAVKIFISNEILMIDRLDGAGAQPAVDGITGIWCEFDAEKDRVLSVYVLARSSTQRKNQTQNDIAGWASAALPKKDSLSPGYRYTVVSRSWRIRN